MCDLNRESNLWEKPPVKKLECDSYKELGQLYFSRTSIPRLLQKFLGSLLPHFACPIQLTHPIYSLVGGPALDRQEIKQKLLKNETKKQKNNASI